jgi:hypothetical protein
VTPRQPTWQLSNRQRRHYVALLRASDPDALHDLLVRNGPEILDRDLPYLVIAARNQLRSRLRRGAASHEIPSPDVRADEEAGSLWDPLARVMADEALGELLIELAELDPRDILVLWSTAAGRSDAEIAGEWDELQFQPSNPSPDLIRKRRERARTRMRDRLRG